MKKKTLPIFTFLIILFCSCSNGKHNSQEASTVEKGTTTSTGKSDFSAVIDGVKVSGAGIDEMQLMNTAFIYPDAKKGKKLIFYLYSSKDGDDVTFNYSFRFDTPDQSGEFSQEPADQDHVVNVTLNMNIHSGNMARYFGSSVKFHITTLNESRVAGTFSGIFKLGPDTPNAEKKEITVTDGVFDIPFSTGKLRPE